MTSSNRTQVASVEEVTLGTTPNTPRMRLRTVTDEKLNFRPVFVDPGELRSDRMTGDSIKVGDQNDGSIDYEVNYPVPNSPVDSDIKSALYNTWTNTPSFDNDGTADSVITDAGTTTDTYTVASGGSAVKASHLVRATGFANSANNQIFKVASSTSTTIVGSGLSLSAETAPAAAARLKVVGFQGASGDITATSTGLGSTSLDFTTLGLAAGQWIKIGGTASGDKFSTAALNARARITAIAAHAITLDNRPSGWTTDAGTGKTIKVWFGDYIKNGTTTLGQTIERGFLGQGTPTYIVHRGMVVNQYQISITAMQKITASATFNGMGGGESQTALDASPDAAPALATYPIFAASANIGRVGEGGSALSSPNWVKSLQLTINNNQTLTNSIDSGDAVDVVGHECTVTGTMETYFGDDTLLAKYYAGTPTALNCAIAKGVQMLVLDLPRVIYNANGSPNAAGKNQDVTLPLGFRASKDESLTNALITLNRFEYYEA